MKQLLEQPVEYGTVRLAPTSELAALAEFATLRDHESRLDCIVRAAQLIRDEDEARDRIAAILDDAASHPLPTRRFAADAAA